MKKTLLILAALCMTLAASATKIVATTTGDQVLSYYVANANAGDTIELIDGEYTEPYSYSYKTANLVVMAAKDAKPVIKASSYMKFYASVKFEGIKFDGQNTAQYTIYSYETAAKNLTFENCEFTGYTTYNISSSSSGHMDSLVINNCLFYDNGGSAVYIPHGSSDEYRPCDYFCMTNSTVYNVGNASNVAAIDVREGATYQQNKVKFIVDHVTLYNFATASNGGIMSYKSGDAVISNCIIANPTSTGLAPTYCYTGTQIQNCLIFNTASHHSGPAITGGLNSDPLFVNPALGNFDFQPGSPAIGAGTDGHNLGDPRWKVQANEFAFEMAAPATDVDATDSYTISWTALDPSNEATITLQYSEDNTNWTNIATGIASNVYSYVWNIREFAAATYYIRGTMANSTDSKTSVALGKLTIVPDTDAPRAVRHLAADAASTTLTLTWENPDVAVPFVESLENTPVEFATGSTSATVSAATEGWKIDFASATWEQTGAKFVCAGLNNMTGDLTFEYKGNSGYQILAMVEQNGYDWWYKSLTLDAVDYTSKTISTWKKLDWHNNTTTAAFDGNNVTGVYFIINDEAATSEGTFYIKNVEFAGEIPASADYTKTIVRVSTVDYPENVTDGEAVYEGTAATCNFTIADAPHYYFSVFTQDDLGNTSEAAHLDWPTSKWATAVDNVNTEAQAVKVISNGQVLIIRNNKVYTTLGAEVK